MAIFPGLAGDEGCDFSSTGATDPATGKADQRSNPLHLNNLVQKLARIGSCKCFLINSRKLLCCRQMRVLFLEGAKGRP